MLCSLSYAYFCVIRRFQVEEFFFKTINFICLDFQHFILMFNLGVLVHDGLLHGKRTSLWLPALCAKAESDTATHHGIAVAKGCRQGYT